MERDGKQRSEAFRGEITNRHEDQDTAGHHGCQTDRNAHCNDRDEDERVCFVAFRVQLWV